MSLDDTNPFKKLDKSLFPDEDDKSSARASGSGAGKSGVIVRKNVDKQGKHHKAGAASGLQNGARGGSSASADADADAETDMDFLRAMAGVARMDTTGGKLAGMNKGAAGKGVPVPGVTLRGGLPKAASSVSGAGVSGDDGLVSMAELEAFRRVVGKDGDKKSKISRDQLGGLFKGDTFQRTAQSGDVSGKAVPSQGQAVVPPARGKDRTSTRISDDVRKRSRLSAGQRDMGELVDQTDKPEPDSEDGEAFIQAMQGVAGITARGRDIRIQPELARAQPVPPTTQALQDLLDGTVEFQLEYSEEYIQGHVSGFDPMEMGKMRSGQYSPEAHLDLHGMVAQQAYEALIFFMRAAYNKGLRMVLLIPGRGLNSPDGFGVLREKLQHWLTHDPFKRVVLAFCTAQPRDGGAGAVYVMLRKFKKSRGKIQWEKTPTDPDLFI